MVLSTDDLRYITATLAWEPPEGVVNFLVLDDTRVLRIDAHTIMLCAGLPEALEGQALPDSPVIRR